MVQTIKWYWPSDASLAAFWSIHMLNIIPVFPSPSFFVWFLSIQPEFLLLSVGLSSAHPAVHSLYFFSEDLSTSQWCELGDAKKTHIIADISSFLVFSNFT